MNRIAGFAAIILILSGSPAFPLPKPVENEFIKVEVADLGLEIPKGDANALLWYPFMFQLKKPLTLTRVLIEDVSEKTPIVVVDDRKPNTSNSRWRGNSPKRAATKENYPWLFNFFDTKLVFRITVWSKEQSEMVLTQKASYPGRTKAQMMTMLERHKKK